MAEKERKRGIGYILGDMALTGIICHPASAGLRALLTDDTFIQMLTDENTIYYTAAGMIFAGGYRLISGRNWFLN